ncbi:MAG: hypothetical protein JXM69_10195 [Anaerolineae bacterium]|nr:hypothetical protein [Anaerolineae bacterium]
MFKRISVVLLASVVFVSTVVCSLGSSGPTEAELAASISTATTETVEQVAEVVEDQTTISEPAPIPLNTPIPEPTEESFGALTAREAFDLALTEALAWQSDASLVSMGTTQLGPLDSEGTSESWSLGFYSPSAGEMLTLSFINGALNTPPVVQLPVDPGVIPALASVILELKDLYDTAVAAAGSQYTGEAYYLMAGLTRYPLDDTVPTWYMNFHNVQNNTVAFTVIIDARSGEVIQAINVAGE